ncbi:CBS domain-containing protein [Sporosarcina limicola]|uniref:Transcriptional regulator n=1 Tax=Sporosarcina limicola TaxID=34101 RepID=A0A927MKH2_9BACL|nr:CBS domain-containing protein [Sporosarcina limicola]MBE1556268.1 putative transcriptional regulator [Sporosarcina limicola]
MTARNSDRFIFAYNRIEKSMEKMSGTISYMPFSRLIDKAKKTNAIIRKFEYDLREYGDLRNAIVHHRTDFDYAIAEPHDEIVELIEYIDQELSKPVTVGDLFQRKVHILQASDSLSAGLKLIREKKFDQIPIYEKRRFIGLITATGITYWLADKMIDEIISREMPTLLDIYYHEKQKNTYRFIKKDLSVYEAEEYFKKAVAGGKRLEALLITENGLVDEKLLGIITPLDLMKIK